MPREDNLSELLSRVALGDRSAFESLYRATCDHLFSVSMRMMRHESRAEEALQDAYVSIWQNAGRYDSTLATPMTWMINVVRNRAIDLLRSGRTENSTTGTLDDEAIGVPAEASSEPHQMLESRLAKSRIGRCMSRLPAVQRQALALAYYRGMVHTDIAQALNAPLGTAKGWVRRGLDRLKLCLETSEAGGP